MLQQEVHCKSCHQNYFPSTAHNCFSSTGKWCPVCFTLAAEALEAVENIQEPFKFCPHCGHSLT